MPGAFTAQMTDSVPITTLTRLDRKQYGVHALVHRHSREIDKDLRYLTKAIKLYCTVMTHAHAVRHTLISLRAGYILGRRLALSML